MLKTGWETECVSLGTWDGSVVVHATVDSVEVHGVVASVVVHGRLVL